jgi:hypothetical protein
MFSVARQVQSADDVRVIDAELCLLEASMSLTHRLCLIPWIETARGVVNASAICSASPRVAAVAFGAEDFARDLRLPNEVSLLLPFISYGIVTSASGEHQSRCFAHSEISRGPGCPRVRRSAAGRSLHHVQRQVTMRNRACNF